MRLIDSHVHFWDPGRFGYPWLAELPALNRRFGPDALDSGGHELVGAVFVEAGRENDQALAEVGWVEELAAHWPTLSAVVAHASVERGTSVASDLAALAARPLVTGVRRNLQDEPAGFATAAPLVEGVGLLAAHRFSFDLCIRHHQLAEVTELARRVPEVTFVLDHLGKPDVRGGGLDPWRRALSRLANQPNVVCKLSGLTTEADHDRWTPADLLPYLRHALTVFGPHRCLVGGDWPVSTLATTYARWLDVVAEATADLTDDDRRAVLIGTASRVYRIAGADPVTNGGAEP